MFIPPMWLLNLHENWEKFWRSYWRAYRLFKALNHGEYLHDYKGNPYYTGVVYKYKNLHYRYTDPVYIPEVSEGK